MNKKRPRVAFTILKAVKTKFRETKQFIDITMEDEFQKEKISTDEATVFTNLAAKS